GGYRPLPGVQARYSRQSWSVQRKPSPTPGLRVQFPYQGRRGTDFSFLESSEHVLRGANRLGSRTTGIQERFVAWAWLGSLPGVFQLATCNPPGFCVHSFAYCRFGALYTSLISGHCLCPADVRSRRNLLRIPPCLAERVQVLSPSTRTF